jgi:hypothetical protein
MHCLYDIKSLVVVAIHSSDIMAIVIESVSSKIV